MPSLFTRVTKYSAGPSLDPRENRLTEVTAAVLEQRVPGFARAFAKHLLADQFDSESFREQGDDLERRAAEVATALDSCPDERVRVRTQVATLVGRFVDLEIAFLAPDGSVQPDIRVWVEVKDAADQHDDQLSAYLRDLNLGPASPSSFLALLVPSWWETATRVPPEVFVADWHGVALLAKDHADGAENERLEWILKEYVGYLEEEYLTVPERKPLDDFSARAMMEERSVEETFLGLEQQARDYIERHWGPVRRDMKGKQQAELGAEGFWVQFQSAPGSKPHPDWRKAWFEFGLCDTAELSEHLDLDSDVVFYAGAFFFEKGEADKAVDEAWMTRRSNETIEPAKRPFRLVKLGKWRSVLSFTLPTDFLGGASLEEQGCALGAWAVEAFTALTNDPPPWDVNPGA